MNYSLQFSPFFEKWLDELSSPSSSTSVETPLTPEEREIRDKVYKQFPQYDLALTWRGTLSPEGSLYSRCVTSRSKEDIKEFSSPSCESSVAIDQQEKNERPAKKQKLASICEQSSTPPPIQEVLSEEIIETMSSEVDVDSTSSEFLSRITQSEVEEHVSRLKHVAIVYSNGVSLRYLSKLYDKIIHTFRYEQQLEDWDTSISESGIPFNMDMICQGRRSSIYMKHDVNKGDFIGALSGTISSLDLTSKGIQFATFSKGSFFLNRSYEGNFLQDLPVSEEGNVCLKLVYNDDLEELQFILVARKKISARENLYLQKFVPIELN